jgi:hypothetical protein
MVDIVLTTDELTVLGGPSQVQVEVDLGQQGDRGSIFLAGSGEPNAKTVNNVIDGVTVNPFDMYVNAQQGPDYSNLYQYVPGDGNTLRWVPVIRMIPNSYTTRKSVTFSNGSTTISDIDIISIVGTGTTSGLTADNFAVQITVAGEKPIASAVSVSPPNNGKLPLTVKASELDGSTWSGLSGLKQVYITITVV